MLLHEFGVVMVSDRDDEAGEASRKKLRQISQLNLNAEDNLAYAA